MVFGTPDGAGTKAVDLSQDSSSAGLWESAFADGMAEIASHADSPNDLDAGGADPAGDPPHAGDRSSDADTPQDAPDLSRGDDGRATPPDAPALASPAPSDPAADPALSADPLAGAEPFTYDVDGRAMTVEGAYRLPGDGLYVPEDKVPHFQQLATQAARVERISREAQDQSATWDRLTRWQTYKPDGVNPDGSPRMVASDVLTGQRGLEARQSAMARSAATLRVYQEALRDPQQFAQLVQVQQDAEGRFFVVPDPQAMRTLQVMAENSAMKAESTALNHLRANAAAPPPPAPTPESYARGTVAELIANHQIANLQPDDLRFLEIEFPRYVQREPNGSLAVNPRFLDVMKDRAQLRSAILKTATASAKADSFNGGMTKGRQQPAKPAARPASPVPAPSRRGTVSAPSARPERSSNDAWSALIHEAQEASSA